MHVYVRACIHGVWCCGACGLGLKRTSHHAQQLSADTAWVYLDTFPDFKSARPVLSACMGKISHKVDLKRLGFTTLSATPNFLRVKHSPFRRILRVMMMMLMNWLNWQCVVVTDGEWMWLMMRCDISVSMSPLIVIPAQFRRPCHAYLFVHLRCMFTCRPCLVNSTHTYVRCHSLIATTFTARRWLQHFPLDCIARFRSLFHALPSHQLSSPFQSGQSPSPPDISRPVLGDRISPCLLRRYFRKEISEALFRKQAAERHRHAG